MITEEKQDKVFVYDKNANVVEQKQPVQIALAHELIHSLRGMKGSRKKAGMGTNKMPGRFRKPLSQAKSVTARFSAMKFVLP